MQLTTTTDNKLLSTISPVSCLVSWRNKSWLVPWSYTMTGLGWYVATWLVTNNSACSIALHHGRVRWSLLQRPASSWHLHHISLSSQCLWPVHSLCVLPHYAHETNCSYSSLQYLSCSLPLVNTFLDVSPIYFLSLFLHITSYVTPVLLQFPPFPPLPQQQYPQQQFVICLLVYWFMQVRGLETSTGRVHKESRLHYNIHVNIWLSAMEFSKVICSCC